MLPALQGPELAASAVATRPTLKVLLISDDVDRLVGAAHAVGGNWPGIRHVNIIKTGDRTYCIIAEWTDSDAIVNARPQMIATLNSFRDTLEDLGGGLGVTDPVSGPVVLALK